MSENVLATYLICDPEECPMVTSCKEGPAPGMPCRVKQEFSEYLNDNLHKAFRNIDKSPETALRVNMLLKPLFEQLLVLRIAQLARNSAFSGSKINPVLKELRQTIATINVILSDTMRSYKDSKGTKRVKETTDMLTSKNYYEMLVYDGENSLDNRVGPE